jgi:replication factor A1
MALKISELKVNQGKVDVEATVVSVGELRTYNKFGKDIKVKEAVISDGSGEIKLSVWNEDTDKVDAGKKVKITNGYVTEFKGEKQLSAGKFGKLEITD